MGRKTIKSKGKRKGGCVETHPPIIGVYIRLVGLLLENLLASRVDDNTLVGLVNNLASCVVKHVALCSLLAGDFLNLCGVFDSL